MIRLIIFIITMLALSGICNGQGVTTYGATRAQDSSKTKGQQVWTAYADADTNVLVTTPNGTVKGLPMSMFEGSSLDFTPEQILNGVDFGMTGDDTTNDAAALQAVIDSAHVLGGRIKLYLPAGAYYVKSPLQKTKNGRACNAQIVIPHNDRVQDGSEGFIYLTIEGQSVPWDIDSYLATLGAAEESKLVRNTTRIISTIDNDGSEYPAILGVAQGAGIGFNHLGVNIKDITFQVHYDSALGGTQLCGLDMNNTMGLLAERLRICLDTASIFSTVKDHETFGIRGAHLYGMMNTIRESASMGFKYAYAWGEHGRMEKAEAFNSDYALAIQQNFQGIYIEDLVPHACKWTFGAGLVDSGVARLNGYYHAEKVNTGAGASVGDLYDPTNLVQGEVQFINFRNGGSYERTFIKTGGANVIATAIDSGRIYQYGNGTYGGIYRDSLNHVITNGGLTASVTSSASVLRPYTFSLNAGYTGGLRTDGMFILNFAAGTGQNINGGTYNNGIAAGAVGATVGYNFGIRGAGANSTVLNGGILGIATTVNSGINMGGLFSASNSTNRNVAVFAKLGTATTTPVFEGSAALIADNVTPAGSIFVGLTDGVRKVIIDSAGNLRFGHGAPSGNTIDIYTSGNSSLGIKIQNTSGGTLARAGLDLYNDAGSFARISKASSGYTTSGPNKANDLIIGNATSGDVVISNSVATGVIDLATNATVRLKVKANGTVNIVTISTYVDNAAALAGGLVAGDLYRTSTGVLMIVF